MRKILTQFLQPKMKTINLPFELLISLCFFVFTLSLGTYLGFPLSLPNSNRIEFLGVHYLYPLLGISAFIFLIKKIGRINLGYIIFTALPCYVTVLICHFNIKLWIPHINSTKYDELYMEIDRSLSWIVDSSIYLRSLLAPLIPLDMNFYMLGFIALFYMAFGIAALRSAEAFKDLTAAMLIIFVLGSISYLIAPAVGPFIFQRGIETWPTQSQIAMLDLYQMNAVQGAIWLEQHGATNLTAGLAAMPSLHTGTAFMFLLFAFRYKMFPLILFAPIFVFIFISSLANRWHYIVDIPAGMLVGWLSFKLSLAALKIRKNWSIS